MQVIIRSAPETACSNEVTTSPLNNSWVQINKMDFYVSNDFQTKVTLNMPLQPASKK